MTGGVLKSGFPRLATAGVPALALCLLSWLLPVPSVAAATTESTADDATVPQFMLHDQNDREFTRDRLLGKWTFMFFGYTHCPDICPLTTDVLNQINLRLKQQTPFHRDTQFVFVSVDPIRDDAKALREFLDYFDKDLIGAVGPVEELNKLTGFFGIKHRRMYAKNVYTGERVYLVEHGAAIVLIAPDASLAGRFNYPQDATDVTARYLSLRRQTLSNAQ